MIHLINDDCIRFFEQARAANDRWDMVFVDPPDNIGLSYSQYNDNKPKGTYEFWLYEVVANCSYLAPITWISFNSRHIAAMGKWVYELLERRPELCMKPCVQVFTFGQHNPNWLGNNHRPLWCIYWEGAKFYPDAIREESWRQQNNDPRADPRGRVPGDVLTIQPDAVPWPGVVFDYPRVTGNSAQRQAWHPTQLHEGLVEKCIKFSTVEGERILDPCAGTGTTGRVAQRLGRDSTLIEIDSYYCERIRECLTTN